MAASEKALGRDESILPGPRVSVRVPSKVRWAAVAAAAVVLAAAGLLVANEYCRRHRTVFAACGGSQVVQLSIDGQPPVPVARLAKFQLAEGRHHVKVSEPVNEEFDIDLETGYFTRWTNSPVWVINADGGVALVVKTMHYAVNPRLFGEPARGGPAVVLHSPRRLSVYDAAADDSGRGARRGDDQNLPGPR